MNLNISELIEIAEKNAEALNTDLDPGVSEVHRFILAMNLKPGKHKVKSGLLYKAYKLWCPRPKSIDSFCSRFAQFFTAHHEGHRYYMLNTHGVELINKADNKKINVK